MVRFDAYTGTSHAIGKPEWVINEMVEAAARPETEVVVGKGFHTFERRAALRDAHGEWGAVQWGGTSQGTRTMFEVKGEASPGVVEALRASWEHSCTRVDACADFDAPRAFQGLMKICRNVKRTHRVWGERRGDWEDQPEKGRTFYLGASTSAVRSRLYEKGLQPEYLHLGRPNWVRLELQVRPQKRAREEYSRLTAAEVWGAAAWSRDLAAQALADHVDPHPAGTTWRRTHRDQALMWMVKQYGPHLLSLAEDLGGWDCLGPTLREMMREQLAAMKVRRS